MNRFALLLVAVGLALGSLPSSSAAQINAFGYEIEVGTYDFVSAPPGTGLNLVDDADVAFVLPWSFPWFAASYGTVYISDNGVMSFTALPSIPFGNACLPSTFDLADLMPFWDDFMPAASGGAGDAHAWHDQTGGNDRVIVSWEGMAIYLSTTGDYATFQVHLHPTGVVEFHYADVMVSDPSFDGGASATVGMQDSAGFTSTFAPIDELEFSCNTAALSAGQAIVFSVCDDGDGDGFDDLACGGDDCDDSDPAIHPGALETCDNTLDEDCDGQDLTADFDADSFTSDGCVGGDDCDDSDPSVNPGVDADGDGSNACDDCDDAPGAGALRFPGNPEVCGNGIDDDCSGADDDFDGDNDTYINVVCAGTNGDDCDDDNAAINPGVDADNDGVDACADCDDGEATAFPGNPEVCDSGIDNDCDGTADDVDGDNDGDLAIACGGTDCDDNDPTVGANTDDDNDGANACDDCDDDDPTRYPGALELCDAIDSDCDGLADAFDLDIGGQTGVSQVEGPGAGGALSIFGPPVVSTLVVTAPGLVIEDLNITTNIAYDPTADLVLTIRSPSGTTVTLADAVGDLFGSPNFTGTVFDDEASVAVTSGAAPFTGSFRPESPLSAFDLEPAAGTWTFTVTIVGFFGFLGGSVTNWGLDFTLQQVDDVDSDGAVDSCGDCDDSDASIYPDAPEICGDGIDQDCDGIDDVGDEDSDGYVDANCGGDDCDDSDPNLNPSVDVDQDGADACADCDDADPDNFPGNLEICGDSIDQDCSGADDSGDADSDGFLALVCIGGDDCDDTQASIYPGAYDNDNDGFDVCADCFEIDGDAEALINPDAAEQCGDGLDNDCDGAFDNLDADGDGYISADCFGGDDCDDSDPAVHPQVDADDDGFHACQDCDDGDDTVFPAAEEICDDAIDQSCSGADLVGDGDGDGFDSTACGGEDCDDANPDSHPDATDLCDGVDLNCDGTTVATDADGDGFFDAECGGDDCDDSLQGIHPQATEVCDGVDNNCDGALLDGGEVDADDDGVPTCDDDCDDEDPSIHPGAQELCDGIDNDCDGTADNGVIRDGDQDGFERLSCGGQDCDDGDSNANPDEVEDCSDSVDNDCDGAVDRDDSDCDFTDNGCACDAGGGDPAPTAALALLLVAGLVSRRRAWSAC